MPARAAESEPLNFCDSNLQIMCLEMTDMTVAVYRNLHSISYQLDSHKSGLPCSTNQCTTTMRVLPLWKQKPMHNINVHDMRKALVVLPQADTLCKTFLRFSMCWPVAFFSCSFKRKLALPSLMSFSEKLVRRNPTASSLAGQKSPITQPLGR